MKHLHHHWLGSKVILVLVLGLLLEFHSAAAALPAVPTINSVTAAVSPSDWLQVSMTAAPNPVRPGETITWEVTVANRGTVALDGVWVTALVPDWLSEGFYASNGLNLGGTCPGGSCETGETAQWTGGSLAPGQSRTVTMSTHVGYTSGRTPPDGTLIQSVATAGATGGYGATDRYAVTVDNTPQVRLAMEEDQDPVAPGATLNYVLRYANGASTGAAGLVLQVPLPARTTFVSASGGGAVSAGVVTWAIGTLSAGQNGMQRLGVLVDPTTANGTLLVADGVLGVNGTGSPTGRSRAVTVVNQSSPLAVSLKASPDPVRPGETITWEVTVVNRGTVALDGVWVEALVPDWLSEGFYASNGLNLGGACPGGSCETGETAWWMDMSLAPGQSRTVTMSTHVGYTSGRTPPDGTLIQSVATAGATGGYRATDGYAVTVDNTPQVRLAMEEDQHPVAPGTTLNYVLRYANGTTTDSERLVLQVPLPARTSFVSASGGGVVSEGVATWSIGNLAGGENGVQRLSVLVDPTTANGTLLVADGVLGVNGTGSPTGRSRAVTVVNQSSPLAMSLKASPDPVRPGETITWTVMVANRGTVALDGVWVTALVPDWLSEGFYASNGLNLGGTCPGGSCETGETAQWTGASLAPGQSRTVTMSTHVGYTSGRTPPDGTLIQSVATAGATGGYGATDSYAVTVDNTPQVRLAMEEDQDPVAPGSTLNYVLRYANGASTAAAGLVLQVPLPARTSFVSASGGGVVSAGVVTWAIGTLSAGENGMQRLSVLADPTAVNGTLLVADAVLGVNGTVSPTGRSRAVTVVNQPSPLAVSLKASPDPVRPGETITWEVTVVNRGAGALDGVWVEVLVPDWLSEGFYASNGLNLGGACPGGSCETGETAWWMNISLAPGQSRTLTMSTHIGYTSERTPPDGTLIQSVATAGANGGYRATDGYTVPVGVFWPPPSPTLSVTPTTVSAPATSGSASFNVNNTGGGTMAYSARVTTGVDWLTIQSGDSGGNDGTINISYDPNQGPQRTGTIVVTANGAAGSPLTLTVEQAASTGGADYPGAIWVGPAASSNFQAERNGNDISYIVIHSTEGSMASALGLFQTQAASGKTGASSHYIVGTTGTVWQVVRDADTAFHCGNLAYNYRSIGVELEGWADGHPDFTWQTAAQRAALVNLINWLHSRHNIAVDRAHLVGHNQIPSPGGTDAAGNSYPPATQWGGYDNHHDPGAWFNWRRLMADLGQTASFTALTVQSTTLVTTLPQAGSPIIFSASPGQKFVAYDSYNGYYLVFVSGAEVAQQNVPSGGEFHWDGWIPAADVSSDVGGVQIEVSGVFPARLQIRSTPTTTLNNVVAHTIDGKRYVATGNQATADSYTWREFQIGSTDGTITTGWAVTDYLSATTTPTFTGVDGGGLQAPNNGQFQVQVNSSQPTVTIQASADLMNWTDVGTLTIVDGKAVFTDTNPGAYLDRFFRLKP
jgi:uncharacterized repeat protein (TIGR01451 family)